MSGDGEVPESLDRRLRETFTWYPVAKKDFKDAIRSRGLLLLSVVFLVFFAFPVVGQLYLNLNLARGLREVGMQLLISGLYTNLVTFLLPIVAIFAGYAAVTKERTSGSLKLLLSLPFSRRDVIVGKVVGRSAVVGVSLAVAFALTALLLAATQLTFKPELYGLFALYTMVFAIVFVAIVVSISGAVPSSRISGIVTFFVYFYFTFTWNSLANFIGSLLSDYAGVQGSLRWHLVLFLKLFNPNQAYKTLTNSMLSNNPNGALSARFGMFSQGKTQMRTICTDVLRGNATEVPGFFGNRTVCQETANAVPFYFSDAAVFVYLLAWIVVAAAISYYTFNRYDL